MRTVFGGNFFGRRAALGGAIGGALGGVGRLAVAVSFLYYVLNWGGPFFRQEDGVSFVDLALGVEWWPMLFLSTCLGVIAGAIGGATCRPIGGTILGGALSGLFCVGLFVAPSHVAIGLSGGGVTDYSADQAVIVVGLVGMILAGAIAGGAGAVVGNLAPPKPQPQPQPRPEPEPSAATVRPN